MIFPAIKAIAEKTVRYLKNGDSAALADVIVDSLQFTGGTGSQGLLTWNADEETVDLIQNGAVLQLGEEVQIHVKNQSGATIPNGTPVMAVGALGASGRILIAPMDGTDEANYRYYLGMVTYDILNGADGKVTIFGKVRGLDTSAWVDGTVLFVSTSAVGQLQTTEPATGLKMPVAFVITSHAVNGVLMVRSTPINENAWLTKVEADAAYAPIGSSSAVSNVISAPTTIAADTSYVVIGYLNIDADLLLEGNLEIL